MSTVLKVSNLEVDFRANGVLTNSPLRGINFEIESGKTLGIVGAFTFNCHTAGGN
jgi:ABC-type glutathione transport system ATPase component